MVAVVSTHTPLRVSFTGTVTTKPRVFHISHIKAHTEEGRWSNNNMADASRSVLKKRIDQVKMKDRLERCWSCGELGWNYNPSYSNSSEKDNKKPTKTQAVVSELSEMGVLVSTTLTLTFVSGTAFLALASLLIHHL